jgi:hypothetical protein
LSAVHIRCKRDYESEAAKKVNPDLNATDLEQPLVVYSRFDFNGYFENDANGLADTTVHPLWIPTLGDPWRTKRRSRTNLVKQKSRTHPPQNSKQKLLKPKRRTSPGITRHLVTWRSPARGSSRGSLALPRTKEEFHNR